jgi:pyridoxine kinase
MSTILSIQSHVVYGHVGNSAAVFPLQRLGCEVWPIHTVQFSSHAGYQGFRGRAFDAAMVDECVAGLGAIGVLGRCDGILSGYLGKPEIGEAALRACEAVRDQNPDAVHACDPVIGDVGRGVYVAAGVGEFFRERALPRATILTPNAFELEWLSGLPIGNLVQVRSALAALHSRGPKVILVTSLALEDTPSDTLEMLASDRDGLWRVRTPRLPISVNGAGDLTAALFLFHWLRARSAAEALAAAAASVFGVVAATAAAGGRELAIVAAQDEFTQPTHVFEPETL